MIQVEDKIISLDVFEKHFVCDLKACKGACCVEGDAGAPLLDEEEEILKKMYDLTNGQIPLIGECLFLLQLRPLYFLE